MGNILMDHRASESVFRNEKGPACDCPLRYVPYLLIPAVTPWGELYASSGLTAGDRQVFVKPKDKTVEFRVFETE